ncbi:hypothetical protein [Bradyrhizobium sp. NC92]|uniref:hypothetical protein n=1 Tax=Bradyrhizobium sp. (strain NC92) TaxID=55395 RepID=UPI0039057E47
MSTRASFIVAGTGVTVAKPRYPRGFLRTSAAETIGSDGRSLGSQRNASASRNKP